MITVHAKGTWSIVGTKTGAVLVPRLTIDKQYEIEALMDHDIVRRAVSESRLRSIMVEEFYQMLKKDRTLYLEIGRTQWSVEPIDIKYEYKEQE